MKKYSICCIFASLLVFSISTLFLISEVNAEEVISVNASGYKNTIIIEFENNSESKIKTVRMWPGGDVTFHSFKSEPGWGGGKHSEGKLLIFTGTNTLNPGESVKFGLTTSERVDGMNWKVLSSNDNTIESGKISIQIISETESSFIKDESEEVQMAKEDGGDLYGTKKFIPQQIRVGSDIRLVGNGFPPTENLKLYLDNTLIKSIQTDEQGNFLTTISIPNDQNIGTSEFVLKDESENVQTTNINIKESNNRFLKSSNFAVNEIPAEVLYEDKLTISGSAHPQSAVVLLFEDMDRTLEKIRVITTDSNGDWSYEETVDRTENLGEKYVIIKNDENKTTKNLMVKSGNLIEISTSAVRYNQGDIVSLTGASEENETITIWVRDEDKKIIIYDIFTPEPSGEINYQFNTNEFSSGTYTITIKQGDKTDGTIFGIDKYPAPTLIALLDKSNFSLNSKSILGIVGPPSTNLSIKILDSNDNIKTTDSVTTSSSGKIKHTIDFSDLSSGIYRAVVSTSNIQDSVKFSVGLEAGSGDISLITTKNTFSPGESILIIGNTGADSRLTITLKDPNNNVTSEIETFSDTVGNFSTDEIGIPSNGELGTWQIYVYSRLDTKTVEINVNVPLEKSLTLELEETEFSIGDTVVIKGIGYSDTSRLTITITDSVGEIAATLETPITADGTFSVPWVIPNNIGTGIFTLTVFDNENSDSVEIDIQ